MKKIIFLIVHLIIVKMIFCQNTTDYSDMNNWYFHPDKTINLLSNYSLDVAIVNKNLSIDSVMSNANNSTTNTGVDVFFVHPTQLTSVAPFPDTVAINNQPSLLISTTIIAQGGILAKYGRFFAPKYRQTTPSAFLDSTFSDSTRAAPLLVSYSDIKSSFLDYLNNYNNGNKIILAGHSQGSNLLAMLLRDLFDYDPALRSKLVTASLGGMAYVYSSVGNYQNGWWENIPLCTQVNECGCVHNWTSFKESQSIPNANTALPAFNQVLINGGLVHRSIDLNTDWFIQDSLIYSSNSVPLRYYITPDATFNLGGAANYIAFDSLYSARFKRESNVNAVLAIDYTVDPLDQRPNDLLSQEANPNFSNWGFHPKDYNIYLWALMEQIDAKLNQCSFLSIVEEKKEEIGLKVYPNPSNGEFTLHFSEIYSSKIFLFDTMGRVIKELNVDSDKIVISIDQLGTYFLKTDFGTRKMVVTE